MRNDQLNDPGREEPFGRLAELITAKGNTFTIYVVGQSIDRQDKPIARRTQRVTVRFRPVNNDALKDDFDFTNATEVEERCRAPDGYTLHIILREDA